jgi:hypothetical protein
LISSYNGIIFDVECHGPFEVDVISVSIGGMLGRIVSIHFSNIGETHVFTLCVVFFRESSLVIVPGETTPPTLPLQIDGGLIEKVLAKMVGSY